MNKISAAPIVIAIAVLFGILAWQRFSLHPNGAVCTQDAKLCPDGSAVGRTGPNCEFAPCPGGDNEWKTFTDREHGISFQYPEHLGTTYIDAHVWPPTVTVTPGIFSCAEETRQIQNQIYCVEAETEGAAGSVYTAYTYATTRPGEHTILSVSFTLRYPQCLNYEDPEKSACLQEEETFDLDAIIQSIVASVQYGSS